MSLLEVMNVSREENSELVLHPINFNLNVGSKLAIVGANGSGKTTLLKLIGGLLQAHTGKILFEGHRVLGPDEQLLPGHKAIAYLSQHFELRNNYHVHELLEMSSKISEQDAAKVYRICQVDHLLRRRSNQLSGGERQRIALATALVTQPKILLLDEPFSHADMHHKTIIKQVLHEVNKQLETAIILVSHEPTDFLPWADEVMVLKNGKLQQSGSPTEVYQAPKNEYVASLTGFYNVLPPWAMKALDIPPSGISIKIIRPEHLKLNTNGNGVACTIKQVDFMGAYNIITVEANSHLFKTISSAISWQVGQTAHLQLM